jgi:carbamoylphosphate synthase small subunit
MPKTSNLMPILRRPGHPRPADSAPRTGAARTTLPSYLKKHGIVAIAGIDTRKLTRILREKGAQAAASWPAS